MPSFGDDSAASLAGVVVTVGEIAYIRGGTPEEAADVAVFEGGCWMELSGASPPDDSPRASNITNANTTTRVAMIHQHTKLHAEQIPNSPGFDLNAL